MMISLSRDAVYLDFEYNSRMVVCCAVYHNKQKYFFDFRDDLDTDAFKQFVKATEDKTYVAYSLNAEIGAMLRLGVDVRNLKCIDLLVESRMVTMSHDKYYSMDSTLLGSVKILLGIDSDKKEKEAMRQLIIKNVFWEDEEWDRIKTYCESDVDELEALLKKLYTIHRASGFTYKPKDCERRGSVIRKSVEMDFASEGFPVAEEFGVLYEKKDEMKKAVIEALPHYWRSCYTQKKDGKWSLSKKLVKEVALKAEWTGWATTANGGLKLDKEYLKKLETRIPEVRTLRQCVRSLQALNSKDLRELEKDGYVSTETFLFCAVTGRNGLHPKRGYLFNLPPWIRKTIKPQPGMVIIGSDWSQQEVAVAAKLSGDQNLIDAYESGDVYLALGKMAGLIPPTGTKKSNALERNLMKILQLGLTYGKQLGSLQNDIYGLLKGKVTKLESDLEAKAVYTWHKQHFHVYWTWIDAQIVAARNRGWIETNDHWMRYVDRKVRRTQLLNFPSQSHGAVMLRIAAEMFYELWQAGECPPIMCTQHDAVYFNAIDDKAEIARLSLLIEAVMTEASVEAVGIVTRSEISVYDHEGGYKPEKWNSTNQGLWEMLQKLTAEKEDDDYFE